MLTPKISTPILAPRFIPESLLELLRPGRVFTAKVETLAGRLLTLWVGGERLEALLSDRVNPEILKPGQKIRLKVTDLGPPLLLSLLLPSEKENPEKVLPRLLQKLLSHPKNIREELVEGVSEKKSPKKPTLERAFFELFRDENLPAKQELRENLLRFWAEGHFLIPFLFGERILWSYLYEKESQQNQKGGARYFVLEIFLAKLGFLTVHFKFVEEMLEVSLCFAREESLILARREVSTLEKALVSLGWRVLIKCEMLGIPPGILLTKEV